MRTVTLPVPSLPLVDALGPALSVDGAAYRAVAPLSIQHGSWSTDLTFGPVSVRDDNGDLVRWEVTVSSTAAAVALGLLVPE